MVDTRESPIPRAATARTVRRYLRFFGARGAADVDDELAFHFEMRVRDEMARGLSEADARAATLRRLGDLPGVRRDCVTVTHRMERRMARAQIIDALTQDVRFGLRTLRRQPGWTVVAILTLALGIGANSAMFSVVDHLLLHPLPFPNADRIAVIFQEPSEGNSSGMSIMVTPSTELIKAWRGTSRSLEALEPYVTRDVTLEIGSELPRTASSAGILPSFVSFSGQRPIIGRVFTPEEARADAGVVMLGEGLWRSTFAADRSVLDRTIIVDGKARTIVGVLPAMVRLPRTVDGATDLWIPVSLEKEKYGLLTVGRVREGITMDAAATELDTLAARMPAKANAHARYRTKLVTPAKLVSFHDALVLLAGAVALVLLIACTNVAHLLLARASTRERELAIRAALGAGRGRLFRQLLTESVMLSGAGCLLGLGFGWAGLQLLVATRPDSMADIESARLDGRTLLVTAALSILTGLVFGIIGAVQAARHSTNDALKAGSRSASAGKGKGGLRSALVISEMALCTMLLVGAMLLLRSVSHLQSLDPGFDAKDLYGVNIALPGTRYDSAAKAAFLRDFRQRASAIPGVKAITIAAAAPPSSSLLIGALQFEGEPDPKSGTTSFINYNGVEPQYFSMMGMRFLEGGTFTDTTDAGAQVIINEGMARKRWGKESAIGRKIRVVYSGFGDWMTVVGVVSNAHTGGLTTDAAAPMLYKPGAGFFEPRMIVRTGGDAATIDAVRALAQSMDRKLPPPAMTSIELAMRKSIARPRFTMFLLTIFTVIAVGLAAVGLYGVLAYQVSQRTREFGIRMALGATRRRIARSVVSRGIGLSVVGALIGLAGAWWSVKLLRHMLYGIEGHDATAFIGGGVSLLLIAVLACVVPTRRAVSVDPMIAMRAD